MESAEPTFKKYFRNVSIPNFKESDAKTDFPQWPEAQYISKSLSKKRLTAESNLRVLFPKERKGIYSVLQ